MNVALSVDNQNSYQAGSVSSLDQLRFPSAQRETPVSSVSLDTNFGTQTAHIRDNYLQLTSGFNELTFSARDFVLSLSA